MVLYVMEEERYADIWNTTRRSTQWMVERSNCRNCLSGQRATRVIRRGLHESTAQIALLYCRLSTVSKLNCQAQQQQRKRARACKRIEREGEWARQSWRERDSSCWALSLAVCVCACVRGFAHCPIVLFTTNKQLCQLPRRVRERERGRAKESEAETATPIKLRRVLCSL